MEDFENQIQIISQLIDKNIEDLGFEIKNNITLREESLFYELKNSPTFSRILSESIAQNIDQDIFMNYLKNSLALNVNWLIHTEFSSQYINFNITDNFIFKITNFSEDALR